MRVLVLGATGFIGGHIARAAQAAGMEVIGLRRRPGAVGAIGDLAMAWREGDMNDSASLTTAMAGCEIVFHAAAYYPMGEYNVRRAVRKGVLEMRRVWEAAQQAGVKRVVYTSSLSTIGWLPPDASRLADERDGYVPGSTDNPYFEVKWAMEHEALRANQAGLEFVTLAPTVVFGPGSAESVMGHLSRLLVKRRLPATVDVVTNFVDVRDVGLAHVRAAVAGVPGERYIVGGYNLSVDDMCRMVAHALDVKPPVRVLPARAARWALRGVMLLRVPVAATVRGLVYWQPLNCEKAWQAFGWQPRPFEDTIRDTVDWLREEGHL